LTTAGWDYAFFHGMTGHRTKQTPDRPTKCKSGCAADYDAPNTHALF
jgi:hypothetical protein